MSEREDQGGDRAWLITGASSGLGLALVRAVLAQGDRVIATARTVEHLAAMAQAHPSRMLVLALDVTDRARIVKVVEQASRAFDGIDVLVNNAGFGVLGAIEEVSDAQTRSVYDTNVFGLLNVTRAVLPSMRARRRGHIINMSSMSGVSARAGLGIYNSAKFAVEGISEALALEVNPLGIRVTVVEPGSFRTGFFRQMLAVSEPLADYAQTVAPLRERMPALSRIARGDPDRAAAAIVKAVRDPTSPFRLVLGADALERIHQKIEELRAQSGAWETVSLSTDYES